ncbi:unnamed protein product, partial [Prorocentrum cordatum]
AWDADVVGYTTPLTTEAGACSVRLAVRAEEALGVEPGNYAAALQAEGSSGWLPGLANTCHGVDGGALGLEVVVLARPDARMSSLMYLPEESLRGLLPRRPAAARVRLLRPLLMKQLADCPGGWTRSRRRPPRSGRGRAARAAAAGGGPQPVPPRCRFSRKLGSTSRVARLGAPTAFAQRLRPPAAAGLHAREG